MIIWCTLLNFSSHIFWPKNHSAIFWHMHKMWRNPSVWVFWYMCHIHVRFIQDDPWITLCLWICLWWCGQWWDHHYLWCFPCYQNTLFKSIYQHGELTCVYVLLHDNTCLYWHPYKVHDLLTAILLRYKCGVGFYFLTPTTVLGVDCVSTIWFRFSLPTPLMNHLSFISDSFIVV